MANNVYLALYKGHKTGKSPKALVMRFSDWLTRKLTKGKYSHCETAILRDDGYFDCYSASIRDGGVRYKRMELEAEKWDLLKVERKAADITAFFNATAGCKYDWLGAFGVVFGIPEKPNCYFCSEWVAATFGIKQAWRFSPNDLAEIAPLIASRPHTFADGEVKEG